MGERDSHRQDRDPLARHPDDELHRLTRGLISMLPLGGLMKEMFTSIVADPAQLRRDKIIRDILERLVALEEAGQISAQRLATRPEFASGFIRTISTADRELEEEKLVFLRNAVVNTAIDENLESSLRAMLFSVLERVTTAHIAILRTIEEKNQLLGTKEHALGNILFDRVRYFKKAEECVIPNASFEGGGSYYDGRDIELRSAVLNDLKNMGLVNQRLEVTADVTAWSTNPAENGRDLISLTTLGVSFLHFIREAP
jgi:hypothetical protein